MDSKASKNLKLQLLIIRTQSGSESGFKELFYSFKNLTLKYLSSLLDEADIEDAHQLVWIKVYQQISKLSSPFGFKRWLMQITHRVAVDHLTRSKKHKQTNTSHIDASKHASVDDITIEVPKNFEQLYVAMSQLSFDHKEIILLFYWQEFTCVEIAQILNCSVGTVKSRLFSARQCLQRTGSIKNL